MLLFGHIGITLASAAIGSGIIGKIHYGITKNRGKETLLAKSSHRANSKASFFNSLANRLDIRFLLIGSLLPDIIDKPIGVYFFRETFSNGRIFSHTLLFLVLVMVAGLLVVKKYSGKTWGLALSIGTLFHLILDQMWLMPRTLLWPLFGIGFEGIETANWLRSLLHALLEEPELYVPEIIGLAVLAWFVLKLLRRGAIMAFLRQGKVG